MYEGLITEHARLNDVRPGYSVRRAVVQVESAYNPVRALAERRRRADAA